MNFFRFIRHALKPIAVASACLIGHGAQAQTLNTDTARQLVTPFYDVLNKPASKNVAEIMQNIAHPNWRSYSADNASKGRDEFVAQIGGFGKLIPDLTWDIKEILVSGDRIIVRSEARGTPAGSFFGVPASGKTFQIMAIDIHTIKDGKLLTAYHVEDWASALRQLSTK